MTQPSYLEPGEMKTYVRTKKLDVKARHSIIHNVYQLKNGEIKSVYSHNGILVSNKKICNTDARYNMDELWKPYVKWKKPDTEDHILYDSIYMKCPE